MTDNIILYNTEDGRAQFRLAVSDGSVWLTQSEMAALFETSKQNVSVHVRNILADGERSQGATVKENLTVQIDAGRHVLRRSAGALPHSSFTPKSAQSAPSGLQSR